MNKPITALLIAMFLTVFTWAGDLEDANESALKEDWQTAVKKYKALAEKGNVFAQLQLGDIYSSGTVNIRKDDRESVRWYKLAAAKGDAKAQNNLGNKFRYGEGVLQNYAEAARLYKMAASQGLPIAQQSLGFMYWEGIGVPHDLVRAHMWMNLAAANDNGLLWFTVEPVRQFREAIAKALTPKQIAQAQSMAQHCQSRNFKNCD
jgi:TPR repeat protein